jgi:hypothetical protein
VKPAALFLVALLAGGAAGALLAAPREGPVAPDAGPVDAVTTAAAPAAAAPDARPKDAAQGERVRHDGTLGSSASVCTPGFPCVGQGATDRSPIGRAPQVAAFDLKASWAATSPLTQRLQLTLRVCQQSCRGNEPVLALAEGGSPLRFAGTLPPADRDGTVVLEVAPSNASPSPESRLQLATAQPYHIEGIVLATSR